MPKRKAFECEGEQDQSISTPEKKKELIPLPTWMHFTYAPFNDPRSTSTYVFKFLLWDTSLQLWSNLDRPHRKNFNPLFVAEPPPLHLYWHQKKQQWLFKPVTGTRLPLLDTNHAKVNHLNSLALSHPFRYWTTFQSLRETVNTFTNRATSSKDVRSVFDSQCFLSSGSDPFAPSYNSSSSANPFSATNHPFRPLDLLKVDASASVATHLIFPDLSDENSSEDILSSMVLLKDSRFVYYRCEWGSLFTGASYVTWEHSTTLGLLPAWNLKVQEYLSRSDLLPAALYDTVDDLIRDVPVLPEESWTDQAEISRLLSRTLPGFFALVTYRWQPLKHHCSQCLSLLAPVDVDLEPSKKKKKKNQKNQSPPSAPTPTVCIPCRSPRSPQRYRPSFSVHLPCPDSPPCSPFFPPSSPELITCFDEEATQGMEDLIFDDDHHHSFSPSPSPFLETISLPSSPRRGHSARVYVLPLSRNKGLESAFRNSLSFPAPRVEMRHWEENCANPLVLSSSVLLAWQLVRFNLNNPLHSIGHLNLSHHHLSPLLEKFASSFPSSQEKYSTALLNFSVFYPYAQNARQQLTPCSALDVAFPCPSFLSRLALPILSSPLLFQTPMRKFIPLTLHRTSCYSSLLDDQLWEEFLLMAHRHRFLSGKQHQEGFGFIFSSTITPQVLSQQQVLLDYVPSHHVCVGDPLHLLTRLWRVINSAITKKLEYSWSLVPATVTFDHSSFDQFEHHVTLHPPPDQPPVSPSSIFFFQVGDLSHISASSRTSFASANALYFFPVSSCPVIAPGGQEDRRTVKIFSLPSHNDHSSDKPITDHADEDDEFEMERKKCEIKLTTKTVEQNSCLKAPSLIPPLPLSPSMIKGTHTTFHS